MTKRDPLTWDRLPLFACDRDIGEAVLGWERRDEFKGLATLQERRGMPKVDMLWGGRYVPAVKRYFDVQYGLLNEAEMPLVPDGNERWPCGDGKIKVRAPSGATWIEDAKPDDPKSWQKKRKLTPRTPPSSK